MDGPVQRRKPEPVQPWRKSCFKKHATSIAQLGENKYTRTSINTLLKAV